MENWRGQGFPGNQGDRLGGRFRGHNRHNQEDGQRTGGHQRARSERRNPNRQRTGPGHQMNRGRSGGERSHEGQRGDNNRFRQRNVSAQGARQNNIRRDRPHNNNDPFDNDQNNDQNNENDNHQGRNNRPRNHRPDRTMGFRYIEDLLNNNDLQAVMFRVSNESNGFKNLLDDKNMSDDMIIILVKLLKLISTSDFQHTQMDLLTSALESRFMDKLTSYINGIMLQTPHVKSRNKHFWNDPDDFWNNLLNISKKVIETIPTYCETIQKLLVTMKTFMPLIEREYSMHISDSIKEEAHELLEIAKKTIQDIEVKRNIQHVPKRHGIIDDTMDPPNDFREIEIIPSADEVTINTAPFLRTNVIDRPYNNVDHYLDIQFRLLREDFIAPLRRGICAYLEKGNKPKDIKIYNPIRFLNVETKNECYCYRMQFDFSKKKQSFTYEKSKKFMFGSLVCFTNDNFETVLFGKIVERDNTLLQKAQLIVGFHEEVTIRYDTDYLMVESSVYFEPYYHVLEVLKRTNTTKFPMEKYIVRVETDSQPPGYLLQNNPLYNVDGTTFYPRHFPISKRFYGLNDAQLVAFRAALTKEFCIIQGPPGTGKTHLGLKIARTLIQNRHAWYNHTPMLVICYTNHALDQFLEGLLPVTDDILRVGGQSKNENLKDYNLTSKRQEYHKKERAEKAIFKKRDEVRKFMRMIKTLNETRNKIAANDSILSFSAFRDIEGYRNSWFAQAKQDHILKWLLDGVQVDAHERTSQRTNHADLEQGMENLEIEDQSEENIEDLELQDEEQRQVDVDDVFDNIKIRSDADGSLISLKQLQEHLKTLNNEMENLRNQPDNLNSILEIEKIQLEIWQTECYIDFITIQLARYKNTGHRLIPRHTDLQNPSSMRQDDRWLLYFSWLDIYLDQIRQKSEECNIRFKEVFRVYNEMREMEDTQIMRQNVVIGMTTTGAARLQSSLKALRSPIVIVEEAAEVLEAHIVAALTNYCQHLILIGDHLQLKPGAADYRIETTYKLGISLFERMVNNNIECYTLNIQHRMRPEISSLIKPHIYPNLEDHESTLQREPILGIPKCLYFIDHNKEEELCQDASKKNIHEAKFLIALARYLILNGYKPEQITILSAYLGQMFEMVREKKKEKNFMLLQDVRISVLDNYQGEESDIILLSLVRSNSEDIAGFLKIQNRVCVALSRARNGFYLMGNMNLLLNSKSENQIWGNVYNTLKEQDAIGSNLTLRCQIHPYRFTQVAKSEDFNKVIEGGCDLVCGAELACGHVCKRRCHIQDRDHNRPNCTEKCNRLLCDDPRHICRKRCVEECGPCTYLVPRDLDCGHRVNIECHIDSSKYKCMELVFTKLPCDHQANRPCSIDPNVFKCPHPCDTRVEPCGHACTRLCHIRVDPDHLEYRCTKPCAKPRKGCTAKENPHICSLYCYRDCEDCVKNVNKHRSCGHVFTIACMLEVEDVKCVKPCKKRLPCGHLCKNKCPDKCGPCKVTVKKIIPECLHKVKIECNETPNKQHCKSRICPRLLPCGHKCTKPCQAICTQKCEEIIDCNISGPCGHSIKKIHCYVKNTVNQQELIKNCTNPCGVELKCKHKCSGTCGECMQSRIHKRCTEKCGVPLVCNHECPIPCREACKPCTRPCGMKCEHSKCKKKCGEPCTPCTNPCSRRCDHVHCKRPCGAICDTPPCTQRCKEKLKCGHPCVGFCNDPCPVLCRICDKEKLTDIFLGSEDEPNAIYVMLSDCGHIFESSDLDEWLNQNKNEIKFKVCPRCSTNITTTARYSDYIKRAIQDVISAKEKSFGTGKANEEFRVELTNELLNLKLKCRQQLFLVSPKLKEAFDVLENRLKPAVQQRRQPINNTELNAIKSKIQTLTYITECFDDAQLTYTEKDHSILHLNMLLDVLLRLVDHVTDQEIEDLELEIKRLHRIIQFEQIKKSISFCQSNQQAINEINVLSVLFAKKRYNTILDRNVKLFLTQWSSLVNSSVIISDKERMEIVKAIGLAKGHWFKCPKGHPFVIGECGGAMQVAKCFCGEAIGGSDHHLLQTNGFAGEMDDAQRHAWPGGLH